MTPNPDSPDSFEKRFRDLQLRYESSKKHIMFIAVVISVILTIVVLGCLLKNPVDAVIDLVNPDKTGIHPTKYTVNMPHCRIPNYEPFNEDYLEFCKLQNRSIDDKLGSCGSLPLLTSITRTKETHTLHLNKQYFSNYTQDEFTCCYSYIFSSALLYGEEENNSVDEPKFMPCKDFNDSVVLEPDFDFVRVACGNNRSSSIPPTNVYQHFHSYVSFKREVRNKIGLHKESIRLAKKFENVSEVPHWEKPWSVMIVGIDALSRLNFLRMMPQTAAYLQNSGWLSLQGYNKVGDNTFPNLAAAVLAGSTEEQLRKTCAPQTYTPVDWCPWIWGRFAAQGYITAYGEDVSRGDTFYQNTGGFRHPPTDYFLRTLLKAADDYTKHNWYEKFIQTHDCIGKIHEFEYILNFSLEFAETLKDFPIFSLFWMNSFSHDDLFAPRAVDAQFQSYLQNLTATLNDTVVVFMSDHGLAYGPYRQREMGSIETNLPFIYFWLPESFKILNPKAVENLIENKHKLASHFDLHMTLLDLLGVGGQAPGCPTCSSLFLPIPSMRTCADAGIPLRYCACTEYTKEPESSTLPKDLGEFLVRQINAVVAKSQDDIMLEEYKCAEFTLKHANLTKRVISKVHDPSFQNRSIGRNDQFFLISIETEPKAQFEAMIHRNNTLHIFDTIIRLDSYYSGSRCLGHPEYQPYCVCVTRKEVLEKFQNIIQKEVYNSTDAVTANRLNYLNYQDESSNNYLHQFEAFG